MQAVSFSFAYLFFSIKICWKIDRFFQPKTKRCARRGPEKCLGFRFFYWLVYHSGQKGVKFVKVSCAVKEITVKQRALANAIGITPARVSQLVKEGVVVRNNEDKGGGVFLYDSVKNYWLTQRKPDEAEAEETIDYMTEKARHEKTKREIAELKLQKMERNAYTARTVELVMTEMLANLRTQLLGLPSKLAPQLDGKTKEQIYTIMTSEIEEKLSELSEYTPELFAYDEVEEVGTDENSD